jgi:hypothetical protein
MIRSQQFPNNLFLFNPQHHSFVRGDLPTLPTTMTVPQALRYFALLLLTIALPASLLITVLVSLTGHSVLFLLPTEILVAILVCGFVAFMGYWHDRALVRSGKVVVGEVIDCDSRALIGAPGHRVITRLRYRFATPENQAVVKTVNLAHIRQQMPDGRRYPAVGTKIAILYADSRHHMLL